MKSHKNDILDLCDNTHAQLRIYREFYHYIIHIANEGRHFEQIINHMRYHFVK